MPIPPLIFEFLGRRLLRLSPDYKYTIDDLLNRDMLDRALRLLYSERTGQEICPMRVGPLLKCNIFPQVV